MGGATATRRRWRWDEFRALPHEPITADIHCVTKWSKLDTHWEGVSLDTLLAQVETHAGYVIAFSDGGYTTNLPIADVRGGKAWIADAYEGAPIPPEHGGPARLFVPHLYFWKSAKWVRGLELSPVDRPGFWEARLGGPLLLVAGGSGIVPLMAMLRHRAAAGSHVPARLLYSSRTFEDIIYREELDQQAIADPDLMVSHTLTRGQPPGWTSYSRRIDLDLLREVIGPADSHSRAYICGPTPFVEVAATSLLSLSYPAERITTERFGPTGGA